MEKTTFTNSRGEVIVFDDFPYKLLSIDGLGGAGASLQTQKAPYQDGSTYIDTILDDRTPALTFALKADNPIDMQIMRAELSRVFNPKLGLGVLRYETDGIVKDIFAVPSSSPFFPIGTGNQTSTFQKGSIEFDCPNPYWRSPSITEEPTFEPLFQFPFSGDFEMGIQRDERIIINDGDAPAPLQIEFHGPAVNPIITNNTTGEYIKVNQTLAEDEVMKIDTTPGQKSVYFVGADGSERNVFNWIDLGSTFFQLIIGENDIQYSADSDIQGAIVDISYHKLYVGI